MNKHISIFVALLVIGLTANAQINTAISYQGELATGNVTADGSHDFSFALFDAAENGQQIGQTLFLDDVLVQRGIFTVELDFGSGAFAGDQLWLEISVQASNTMDPLELLTPRQTVLAAPYALHAEMVALDAVGGAEIANGSISGDDIATNSIQSFHIQDGSGSDLNADLLDGMDSQDFAQQAVIDNLNNTITALQQQLNSLNDRLVNGPEILGRSAPVSNGRFNFNNLTGSKAANAMCQTTFNTDPGAHMCTSHEVQRALASGRFPTNTGNLNNQTFWTNENTFLSSRSNWQHNSVHSNCSGLLDNAADVANGTTMTLRFNQESGGNGGGIAGDFVNMTINVACGIQYPVLCCQ